MIDHLADSNFEIDSVSRILADNEDVTLFFTGQSTLREMVDNDEVESMSYDQICASFNQTFCF